MVILRHGIVELSLIVGLCQAVNIMVCHKINCTKYGVDWVCGSDGNDYLNRCELNRMRCFGMAVEEVKAGKCKEANSHTSTSIQTCSDYKMDSTQQILLKYWKVKYFNQFGVFSGYPNVLDYMFSLIDLNIDNRISFSEWNHGILEEKQVKVMKLEPKCIQRIVKYCDFDYSRAIERKEWLECFEDTINSFKKLDINTPKSSLISTLVPLKHSKLFSSISVQENKPWTSGTTWSKHNSTSTYEVAHKIRSEVCHGEKRRRFLQLLFTQFRAELQSFGVVLDGTLSANRRHSAEWKFRQMDGNKDNYLTHHEYQPFRKVIRHWEGVKRCGRSFIRICDSNNDKKISFQEWTECTVVAFDQTKIMPKSNPLLYLLNFG
ncbi:unnamed protein product [Bursaphelenchus okinawaensis]|uniref:Kazal-like domain-containing protein n=1 Tax=Bursaphelenchus okinawaensis TaxID=465554 RepID=A0A811L8X7_9BILA|nr:unnamed protein product [Bursaphelenchus okinawaensis]CAG9118641.1 unnamed protein product [Bursaphelenchus okinawaensis]